VNDEFLRWLGQMCAGDNIGEVKEVRGHRHDYLAMDLGHSIPGEAQVDMTDYVKDMVEDSPEGLSEEGAQHPWSDDLSKVDEASPKLVQHKAEGPHTFVAKALSVSKRARPDTQPVISSLTT